MSSFVKKVSFAVQLLLLLFVSLHLHGEAQQLQSDAVLPVVFQSNLDLRKVRVGDPVVAVTTQSVHLRSGEYISRGAKLVGHVVQAVPYIRVQNGYDPQPPSLLAVHFDTLHTIDKSFNVNLQLRALADLFASRFAATPQYDFEEDARGTVHLIGGLDFDPFTVAIRDSQNDIIAYNRTEGVFGKLQAAQFKQGDKLFSCDAINQESALAIFAPNACGIYGFDQLQLIASGEDASGTFAVASYQRPVLLRAGTTALLQQRSR